MPGVSIPPFLTLPQGVSAETVETDHGSFAVLDTGIPPQGVRGTALLVPGFTGSKEDFIAILEPLAERGVRGVALDLAGQFESPAPDGRGLSLAAFASGVWAVAAGLPRPLVLVGHSFGGLVVREAVLSNPLAADGMVLIASGPAAVPDEQQELLQRFAHVMTGFGLEAVWQGRRAMEVAEGVPERPPAIEEFLTRRFLANSPMSLAAMITELCGVEDLTAALAAVAPPSVVVIGGLDDVWPLDQQRHMADDLGARTLELPDAGHSPAVDDPAIVAEAIASLVVE